jgi:hypothetical protein
MAEIIKVEDILKEKHPDIAPEIVSTVVEVVKGKTAEIYTGIDNDIAKVVGKPKPDNKRTFEWLTEELIGFKTKAETIEGMLKGDIEAQKAKNAELEQQLKDGKVDEATKTKLEALEKQLKDELDKNKNLSTKYEETKAESAKLVAEEKQKNHLYRVKMEIESGRAGLPLKDKELFSEALQKMITESATSKVLSLKSEFVADTISGNESLVFRDANGDIIKSKENPGKPATAVELLLQNGYSEIVDPGRKQGGNGTVTQKGGNGTAIDIGSAKTKPEALDLIRASLEKQGITGKHPDWWEKFDEAKKNANVDALPAA